MVRTRTEIIEPVRSCIGCRARRPQSALVRITRNSEGIAVDGSSSGRGAWICRNTAEHGASLVVGECLDVAIAKRAFARAWRSEVSGADITNIREQTGHM